MLNVGRADWNFNRGLADAVASILGGVSVSVDSDAAPDTRSYRVDFSMSRQVAPNHQPRVSLEDAIQGLAINRAQVWGLSPEFRTSNRIRLRRHHVLTAAGFLDEEPRWRKR
jgi:hypothetical protein